MPQEMNFMIGGEAGQGVQSMGFILAKALARGGYQVFADQDYESRIRGGHNFFRVRVKDSEVTAIVEPVDVLLALNRETIELHQGELATGGVVIYDGETISDIGADDRFLAVPLQKLALEVAGNKLAANTIALGVAMGLVDYDLALLSDAVREQFGSGEVGEANVKAAKAGYEYAGKSALKAFNHHLSPIGNGTCMLMNGNEAVALGALAAGCKFMAGYPMTPSTPILEYMAGQAANLGLVVVQPEDEISAINMVVGAAFAGVRAMTATSGSGFCLMVEGLGLAGITETPAVIVNGQRPGPAVGLPTRTEQGDLLFAIHAHHGDFPRAVLAPATIEDAFWLTIKAFNLAEKYQLPVIILTDHYLVTSYATVPKFDLSQVVIDRGLLLSKEELTHPGDYKRHQITESGISPRAVPLEGTALVVTDADEHDEEGHLIEGAEIRAQMVSKRLRKLNGLRKELAAPRVYGPQGAETCLVGWGSTYGALKEAVQLLRQKGVDVNLLHFSELWPFPTEATSALLSTAKKIIVVENNATGQLARLIRSETGIQASGHILKFDGRPFSPAYIVSQVEKEAF